MKWNKPLGGDIYEREWDGPIVLVCFLAIAGVCAIVGGTVILIGLINLITWSLS